MMLRLLITRAFLLTFVFITYGLLAGDAIAQSIAVSGRVTSATGANLVGASVLVKGTSIGASTNQEGRFQINVNNKNAVLVISFSGYTAKNVPLNGRTNINVILEEDAKSLDAVVVVGYGSQRKKDLTGSVETVDMKTLTKAPVSNFSEALAGRVAGVQVSANDAQPGSTPNIVIRGVGSLTQSSSPLYVVDGFPMEDFIPGSLNNDDILSINILKDASATAIYGARAANGVVVIETKKGKVGKPVIDFNNSYGFQRVGKVMELMSPYEFLRYNYELDSAMIKSKYLVNGKSLESFRNEKGIDWQDEIFQTSPWRSHNISIRGGNVATKYSVSGSIFNQEGIIRNTGSKRYQGRVSLDQKINDRISAGINVNNSYLQSNGAQAATSVGGGQESSYLFYNVWGYRPISGNDSIDLLSEDVDPEVIGVGSAVVNPVKSLDNTYDVTTTRNLLANLYINYNITKDLVFRITGGIDTRNIKQDQFFNSQTPQGSPKNPNNTRGINGAIRTIERNTWSNENTLNYKRKVGSYHALDVLGGFSVQKATYSMNGFGVSFLPNEQLGMSGLDEGIPYESFASLSENSLASFFGRFNYNFKSRYLFTATFRGDGTSKFASGKKWGYFPSAAFAWNISEEPFLKNLGFISNAKLRTSYGVTGNNRVSDFAYLPSLNLRLPNSYSFGNGAPTPGVIPSSLGNSDLKWETTHQADFGLDLGFFNNRIEFTADVYRKITTDLLLNAELPPSTGYSNVYGNIGRLKNEGLELSLNTVNIQTRVFSWSSNFNISFNRNEILELTRGQENLYSFPPLRLFNQSPLWVAQVGGPAARFYGFIWDGVYQYEDFDNPSTGVYVLKAGVPTNGAPRANIKPGDIKYRDLTGDGIVDDADRTTIGRGLPIHTGGFTNNFRYKDFDLSAFFQWSYGNMIMNANRMLFEGNAYNSSNKNQFASYIDRWSPANPTNQNFRAGGGGPAGRFSTRTLEDGSYLRLKTLSLGYNLSNKIIKRANISSLRFGIAAQNLLTWTNYTGMDPEVSVRNSILTPGYDLSAYPNYKTLVFTLSATF